MLERLLLQYKEIFGSDFPLAEFDGRQELEVINILYDCVLNSLPYDPERKITPRITEAPGVKNGSFTGTRVAGNGVFAQMLLDAGVPVVTEEEYKETNNRAGW